ncbi:MAG: MMPL family transporter [Myxococcota bacterium]|nr:MMPL family transporter [Myxococcota bacterium]
MLRHHLALAFTLLVSLVAAAALVGTDPLHLRMDLDPSSEPLLPVDDPGLAGYRQAVLDFGDDEIFVVAMETDEVFTTENLTRIRRVGRAIAALPGVRRVESLANVTVIRNDAERDLLEVRSLVRDIPTDAPGLAALRAQALADPLLVKNLVSADGRTAAFNVRLDDATDLVHIRSDIDGRIRAVLEAEGAPGRFHLAGRPHMKAVAHATMVGDLQRLLPLSVLVMALVLWVVTGSLRGVFIPLGTVLVATLWTFGAMAFAGVQLNLLTLVLGPVLIAVGAVYGVHILAHYEAAAERARDPREAATLLSRATRAPVLMAGTSTMVGFGSLLLTGVPAARELGAFAALGVLAVTWISLTSLPALVAVLPLRTQTDSPRARRIGRVLDRGLERQARFVRARSGVVVVAWIALCLVALALVPRIEVDTDYLSFFPSDSTLRRDFETVNERLAGAVPIYVVLRGSGAETFGDPANLLLLERIQRRFDAIPAVTHSVSVVDLVRVVHQAIRDGDPREARVPEGIDAVAEVMLVIPKAKKRPLLNVDHSRANLFVRAGEQGSGAVRNLVAQLEAALEAELPEGLRAEVTGDTVLLNRSADALVAIQTRTVGLTALAVFAIVALAFRSLPLACVALAPNLVPVLLFYGLLGLGIAPLSLPTSLIASIVLGIAVDDTVHFLARYRRGRAEGLSPGEAVVQCGRRVGRPIAITSVMLFLGFLVVSLSGFATLSEFGLLVGLTVLVCLATDLVLLPALLVRYGIAGVRAPEAPPPGR